jgi:hypothetical protein
LPPNDPQSNPRKPSDVLKATIYNNIKVSGIRSKGRVYLNTAEKHRTPRNTQGHIQQAQKRPKKYLAVLRSFLCSIPNKTT